MMRIDYAAFIEQNRGRMMQAPFDHYLSYMEQNRERFEDSVFDFAVDIDRHNLASPHSLHDAWMTSITVQENRNAARPFDPQPTIKIVLLGPMHDRNFVLTYSGVFSYDLRGCRNPMNYRDTFQGDVLWHRVTVGDEDRIIHQYQFASNSSIVIECEHFVCTETMLVDHVGD